MAHDRRRRIRELFHDNGLALASKFCQIAWVVKDIAAAERFFIETMGVEKFLRMENLSAVDTEGHEFRKKLKLGAF